MTRSHCPLAIRIAASRSASSPAVRDPITVWHRALDREGKAHVRRRGIGDAFGKEHRIGGGDPS